MLNVTAILLHRLPRLVCASTLFLLSLRPAQAQTSNVVGWGNDTYGQLGNGSTSNAVTTPVFALTAAPITAIAAGYEHTAVLQQDGTVWAWGYNAYGQLGDGTTTLRPAPVQVAGPNGAGFLTGVTAIAAGGVQTVALKQDRTIWAWGFNGDGELGDGTRTQRNIPVQVVGPNGAGVLTGIVALAAGFNHTLALKQDGTVWGWGDSAYGELGSGMPTSSTTPLQVLGPNGTGYLTGVTAISVGTSYSAALKQDGTVWAWGRNDNGQLGDGTTTDSSVPVQVAGPNGVGYLTGVQMISAGADHTVAVKQDNTVWTWGDNISGQLGDGTYISRNAPMQVKGAQGLGFLTGVVAASAGFNHTVALRSDGTVWGWGASDTGAIGAGMIKNSLTPTQTLGIGGVGYLTDVTAIVAREYHTIALLAPPATVSGIVTLQGCMASQQPITFAFRPTDGSAPFTRTQTLAADGSFFFDDIPRSAYNVAIKGAIWLQKIVAVDARSGNVSGVAVTLPAGDANNDNSVDILDFSVLVDAFGSAVNDGTGFYDVHADFNCNGVVDVGDFGLLVNNYGDMGNP